MGIRKQEVVLNECNFSKINYFSFILFGYDVRPCLRFAVSFLVDGRCTLKVWGVGA
jgi:hypothetical protein